MAKLSLVPNKRTLVRGYFLDTISYLNEQKKRSLLDGRSYSNEAVQQIIDITKSTLMKEVDELTKDIDA